MRRMGFVVVLLLMTACLETKNGKPVPNPDPVVSRPTVIRFQEEKKPSGIRMSDESKDMLVETAVVDSQQKPLKTGCRPFPACKGAPKKDVPKNKLDEAPKKVEQRDREDAPQSSRSL